MCVRWQFLLKNIKDFEFYTGPSFDTEGAMGMMTYEGADPTTRLMMLRKARDVKECLDEIDVPLHGAGFPS